MADWSHSRSWSGDPLAVAAARRFVGACLTFHHDERAIYDVSLVVSELATNAVVHARTGFTVTLAGGRGSLLLTVSDASAALPDYNSVNEFAPGGRGLPIVEAFSVAWGTSPEVEGGKSVWASFDGGAQTATGRAVGEGVREAVR